jgi:hypothetical protein
VPGRGQVLGQKGKVDYIHVLMIELAILLTPRCQQPHRIITASSTHRKNPHEKRHQLV